MSEDVLIVDREDGVVTLTLNRPESMNALSRELRSRLTATFSELKSDPDTRAVIITGAGRAFCAGLDLKELAKSGIRGGDNASVPGDYDIVRAMRDFDRPIIGAVNGVAVTGGFELALACDLLIASTQARRAPRARTTRRAYCTRGRASHIRRGTF